MEDKRQERQSLKKDLADIYKKAWWVALFIVLPTLGLQSTVVKLLGAEEVLSILQIFAFTAPLTLTIVTLPAAIFLYLAFGSEGNGSDTGLGLIFFVAAVFIVILALCNLIGLGAEGADLRTVLDQTWQTPWAKSKFGIPFAFIYQLLATYWKIYGPWSFISSIVVGIFLIWALYIKLLSRIIVEKQEEV